MREFGKSSVFRRLAILFFVMELVVLVGVSLLLFRYARKQELLERETREETIAQSVALVDQQIESVYRLAESLGNDSRLSQIAYHMYPDEYQRSKLVLGVLDTIKSSVDLNAVVEDIIVTFPREGMMLSSSAGYENHYEYHPIDETEAGGNLFFDGENLKVRVAYPLISRAMGNVPDYQCEVVISSSFFKRVLTVFGDTETFGAAMFLEDSEGGISHLATTKENADLETVLSKIDTASAKPQRETAKVDRHSLAISSDRSSRFPIALVTWRSLDTVSTNILFTLVNMAVMVVVIGGLFLLLMRMTNRRVARPLYRLMDAFDQVGKGSLDTRIHHDKNDEFTFLYDSFNGMAGRTEQLVADIKEQHNLLQNAELMQLQAQIDPHFLYNSFNIIKYMADGEEYEQITEFVSALAQYYRFINKETRQAIPLSAEVQHMETYLYIQQMRFEERIHVEVSGLPREAENIMVPKLILQPLVENCYNYGIKNKLENGVIRIRFTTEGDLLFISVCDNGEEMTEDKLQALQEQIKRTDDASVSHALANIRRRLELAYGEPDLLRLSIGDLGGLEVTLCFDTTKIPLNLT